MLKKVFQFFGLSIFLALSFFYTENIASVVKNMDEIMIKIKEESKNNYIEPKEAIIQNDKIIPGKNGKEIDIDKSYRNMHYIGNYNKDYLEFKTIYVKNRLMNNKDKNIISGNELKNNVSIVLLNNSNSFINVINLVKEENVSILFLSNYIENNTELLKYENKKNISVGTYDNEYNDINYPWVNNFLKTNFNVDKIYCLKTFKDTAQFCMKYDNYTIESDIINGNYYQEVKNNLKNGKIFIFNYSNLLESEFDLIVRYIKSKGYNLVTLDELISE